MHGKNSTRDMDRKICLFQNQGLCARKPTHTIKDKKEKKVIVDIKNRNYYNKTNKYSAKYNIVTKQHLNISHLHKHLSYLIFIYF